MNIKQGAAAPRCLRQASCRRICVPRNIRSAASTSSFPTRPAAASTCCCARMAEGFSAHFKQSFVVSNRTGAGGALGVAYVARSAPDGHTLLFVPALAYSVLPLMQSNVGYTDKSFAPICQTFENQMALIVRPDSPFKTARDIVEAARAKDGIAFAIDCGRHHHPSRRGRAC